MDLLAQFRQSVRHPFQIKNVFVIFVTLFLVLIVGLALILSVDRLFYQQNNLTTCDQPSQKIFIDSVEQNNDTIYKVTFSGNTDCFLTFWMTWAEKKSLSLWVYSPSGDITTTENTPNNSYLLHDLPSPLEKGEWRFVVKSDNSTKINYKGELALH